MALIEIGIVLLILALMLEITTYIIDSEVRRKNKKIKRRRK